MAKKEKKKEQDVPVEETVETPVEEIPEVNPFEEKFNAEHEAHLRLAAEYANFRKRTAVEKENSYTSGKADAIEKLLPVYDNLSRAMAQETTDAAFKKGVEMTMNELVKILNSMGVEIIGQAGDTFDPNLHNAIMHTEDDSVPENTITQVFQQGFKMGEKMVRFAMVQVAN